MKIIDIVWILRKIRHLLNSSKQKSTIIFIDHDIALSIVKQVNMIIIFIDKLNLRLIKIFDYIQRFELEIRYKSNKQHIVFDALFKLINTNIDTAFEKNELNALFITILMKVEKIFFKKIIKNYFIDLNWKKIFVVLKKQNKNVENDAIFFIEKSTNSFFIQMNSSLTIMRTNFVDSAYHIQLFKTF